MREMAVNNCGRLSTIVSNCESVANNCKRLLTIESKCGQVSTIVSKGLSSE
ncbi:6351_t:CDS:1, partial [Dentiscutata erythropus]